MEISTKWVAGKNKSSEEEIQEKKTRKEIKEEIRRMKD